MPENAAQGVILGVLEEYAADLDETFSPASFVRWVREHRPEVFERVGESSLAAFASELIAHAAAPRSS